MVQTGEKVTSILVQFFFSYVFVINNTRSIVRRRWYSKLGSQKDSIRVETGDDG